MSRVTLRLEELAELSRTLSRAQSADLALPLAEALADVWVETSRRLVPVDTGQTKARTAVQSVSGSGRRGQAVVISDTPYAGFIDQGTSRVGPRPYFRRGMAAAEDAAADLGGTIETELRRVLQSGGVWNPRALLRG